LAWLYIYGYWPENDINHKDRIKHHNWISNLREISQQYNTRNIRNLKNNKSGVKGVCKNKRSKYKSYITVNNKKTNFGQYKDFNEAICHHLAAEQCLN